MKPKVYWAGPLFSDAEREWNEKQVSRLEALGYEVYLPQRDTEQQATANDIYLQDKIGVDCSDIVVAVCDGADMDSGTAWECGYAKGKDKKVFTLRTDFRKLGEKPGEQINLMISQSADQNCVSLEQVIGLLKLLYG